jgi:addiction module HigA family antidote
MVEQNNEVYTTDDMSIGEFIKDVYMSEDGGSMTMQQIADACGTTQATISRLINGKQDLTIELAFKLEKGLGRSAQSWMNLFVNYKIWEYKNSKK